MVDLDSIVGQLEGLLGTAGGRPVPLEGGITNRNFRLKLGEREYVLRLPGKDTSLLGIDRDAERIAGRTAAKLGIGPEVAAAGESYLLTAYLGARPLDAGGVGSRIELIATALRSFHDSGVELPVRFWVPELLDAYACLARGRGLHTSEEYAFAVEVARRIAKVLPLSDPVPSHNDLLPANVLLLGGGEIVLVDWEYAGMGHRLFDLGNLAVNSGLDDPAEERLLSAYFGEQPSAGRHAALKLMRLMSDAREGAWGVAQSVVSELQFDFAGYSRRHFERLRAAAASDAFEEWLHDASA